MMRTTVITALALAGVMMASAAQADEATVKKLLGERVPELQVQGVKKAPVPGWYEVFSGNKIYYVDELADFIFAGALIDSRTKRNLTEDRIRDLMRVKFDALPFDDAIKIVKGNGSRKIAVFEDPDCPFCKKVEATLAQLDNYTLYVFLYPIEQLHADAANKSRKVWCAKDRAKAWLDLMLKNQVPQNKGDCANPIAKNIELAANLRISGTPALIFEDGRLYPGAIPKEDIERIMTEASAQKSAPKSTKEPAKEAAKEPAKEPAK